MKNANILSVSLRLAIIAVLCTGAFFIGRALSGILAIVIVCVLLAAAAAVLAQLVVWGFKWLKNERVSELGLHIVRFAIILTAVALSVFVMLSRDYTKQHSDTAENELTQLVLAGEVYMQGSVGEKTEFSSSQLNSLHADLCTLLIDSQDNANRFSNIYVYHDVTDSSVNTPPFHALDGSQNILAASSDETMTSWQNADTVNEVCSSGTVKISTRKIGSSEYLTACAPIFSTDGKVVGALEICELKPAAISVFGFATLELMMTVAALLILFACAFYGVIQLIDILLRPRRYDPTRILPFGRESVRPVSFFITMAAVVQLPSLLLTDMGRGVLSQLDLPFGLEVLIPFVLYLLGTNAGLVIGRFPKNTLRVVTLAGGIVLSLLCCALRLFGVPAMIPTAESYITLALIALTGLGHGVAFRIASRFQMHSDAQYNRDKYAYLSPCFGAITGIILGAFMLDEVSVTFSMTMYMLLTLAAAVISFVMLRDIEFTADDGMNGKNPLVTFRGALMVVICAGAACCFNWIYSSVYISSLGISLTAISLCAIAPVAAFCFGNRLKLKTIFCVLVKHL